MHYLTYERNICNSDNNSEKFFYRMSQKSAVKKNLNNSSTIQAIEMNFSSYHKIFSEVLFHISNKTLKNIELNYFKKSCESQKLFQSYSRFFSTRIFGNTLYRKLKGKEFRDEVWSINRWNDP